MSGTYREFVAANAASPVTRIANAARSTTYHLEDGSSYRLDRGEIDALSRMVAGGGLVIRLSARLRQRLGE